MRPAPATLSAEELKRFHDDGYVIVRGAFTHDDALAMQHEWWSELADAHGILRQDRSTWRTILGDLKRAKQSPIQEKIATERVRGVIDDLLGSGAWRPPRNRYISSARRMERAYWPLALGQPLRLAPRHPQGPFL